MGSESLLRGLGWPPGGRLLLVEDDGRAQARLAAWLRGAGFVVTTAIGAAEEEGGIRLLPSGEAVDPRALDGAVLDHYFPGGLDGRSLTGLLRAGGLRGSILAVSSSAAANERMVALGATYGIVKRTLLDLI
jgi:DNA-binding response OmpR family regulator